MIECIIAVVLTALTLASRHTAPSVTLSAPSVVTHDAYVPPVPLSPASESSPSPTPEWGKLIQTGTHTYKIAVGQDAQMTTPDELLTAINDVRRRNGAQPLQTDSRLCAYTQQRADGFAAVGNIDAHAGFNDFLEHQDGFKKLGYMRLGENSSIGYRLSGVHLVEFVYMKSPGHNQNQLDPAWDHGCAGVSGTATNIIFATSPY